MSDEAMAKLVAEDAAGVAVWALLEEQQQPWWRFLRRRYLQRVYEDKCAERRRILEVAGLE